MAKINESYEAMVIFSSKLDEEAVNALTAKFNDLIEANASDVTLSNWGKRKLAYAINYETEVLMYCGHSHLRLSFQLSLREFLVSQTA